MKESKIKGKIPKIKTKNRKIEHINKYIYFFNWDFLHAVINRHSKAWSYKKKRHKKVKAYRKSIYKQPTDNRCLLILESNPIRS